MFLHDLLFVFFLSLILTLVFAVGFRRHAWGGGLILFFLILFLATWAGGMWITPFGPVWRGVAWLPFIFVGIIIALLLTAVMRPDRIRPREEGGVEMQSPSDSRSATALDLFVWILIGSLLVAIAIGYLIHTRMIAG
jgi:hypothetical protein